LTVIKPKYGTGDLSMIHPPRSWILFVIALVLVLVLATPVSAVGTVPRLDAAIPASGPLTGGTVLTLYGAHFDNPSDAFAVYFGDVQGIDFLFVNDKKNIQITAPPSSTAGSVILRVRNINGNSTETNVLFTYTGAPTVTGISPDIGPTTGGTTVTISGYNFNGATAVRFGTTPATSYTVNYATSITATSPPGAGTVDVTVTTPLGTTAAVAEDRFRYTATPTITDVTPSTGTTAGGTAVTITGANFIGATSVTFGGIAAGISSVSDTMISVTTPARTAGTVTVSVVTPNGTANSANAFIYTTAPTITEVSPSTGGTSGGTAVIITGVNLLGATGVTFGGTAATGVSVINSTAVSAITPARTAGTVTVSIVTPNGTANRAGAYTYAAPAVSLSLDEYTITLPLAAGETATDDTMGIFVSSNVAWTVTVSDNTGRATNLGRMGKYTGSSYDLSGPALANPLGLAGTPYGGAVTTHTINPPITATPQILYSGNSLVGQLLAPNTFTQQVTMTDVALPPGSTYRIDLGFTITSL
jgi:hypothetical protein